ncbi:hypothetical protein HYPDE_23063 [Hyphomicrobium denitrificans 1NES1]|uniref:Uncharacterized protein n=2 Tax=Hyphomicrobium denitrificans TaxID=53399 RepID=N0AYT5_9HYPH|nr:hypothetical protein HYPDE_23063 [Hyphomicrobium denitrificans 1NES1]
MRSVLLVDLLQHDYGGRPSSMIETIKRGDGDPLARLADVLSSFALLSLVLLFSLFSSLCFSWVAQFSILLRIALVCFHLLAAVAKALSL